MPRRQVIEYGGIPQAHFGRKVVIMNTVIANQYGQVHGEVTESGLVLTVDAETPRRDSVHLTATLDSGEQIVYLLAVLGAVGRRIDQFQLKDSSMLEAGPQEDENSAAGPVSPEPDLFEPNSDSKHNVYGRFPKFLLYEQLEQGRLRVFFAARDDRQRVARFDLHPGEVRAFEALAERALFGAPQVDLLLRDDLSLAVALSVSGKGMVFEVQTPMWQSRFAVAKANNVATLGVFAARAINGAKVAPIRFDRDAASVVFRKNSDGRILAEFRCRDSSERATLSRLHLYEIQVLTRYVLYRSFEPENGEAQALLRDNAMTSATS